GSASVSAHVDDANDYKYSVAIATVKDGSMNLFAHAFNPDREAMATIHNNNATYGLGKNANNSYHFNGEIIFAGVLDSGISDFQAFALRLGLESILSDVIDWPGSIIFEGNSLTGQASGGGSPYPTKLMAKAGWTDIKRWSNVADGGAEQTQKVEAQYFTEVRQWMAIAGQKAMFIIWSGINDISNIAGLTTDELTASLQRSIQRAKAEGFWVGLIPLTPVASDGDTHSGGVPFTYTYSPAQQALKAGVNQWMETVGAELADQFIDIRLIGDTYPEFLDPTDSTYYTAGDGLHHNDTGRQLIADYIDSVVSPPIN
ncbi:MAG: SGNH/GDSL hydrolase family protein, partial [Akkermansiaceae bacterium]